MQRWSSTTNAVEYNTGATGLQQIDYMLDKAARTGIKLTGQRTRCINASLPTSGTCTAATITNWADEMSTYVKSLDPNQGSRDASYRQWLDTVRTTGGAGSADG